MPRLVAAALLAMALTSPVSSDTLDLHFRVKQGAPVLTVHPEFEPNPNDNTCDKVARLKIYRGSQLLQTLRVGDLGLGPGFLEKSHADAPQYFKFEDCNFDGYKDITMVAAPGIMGNTMLDVWLYQPSTGRFVFNQELADLTALQFDHVHNVVRSLNQSGAGAYHTQQTLTWVGSHLQVQQEEDQRPMDADSPNPRLQVITKRRIAGRLRTVEIDVVELDGHGKRKVVQRQRL